MKKFTLEAKVVITIIFLALLISVVERYEMTANITKQFLDSQKARNELLLNTISPIISLNISLNLLEANKEYLDEITHQNPDILILRVINNDGAIIYDYIKKGIEIVIKKNNENYFIHKLIDSLTNEQIAKIELYVSQDRYEKVLQNNTRTSYEVFFITLIILLFFILAIKKEFSYLKELTENILKYDPKKNNFPLENSLREDEVGIIHNSIIKMVKKIHSHTYLLDELNSSLEEKVLIRTKELSETNKELNEYKLNLEQKVTDAIKEKEDASILLAQQSKMASLGEMLASITHQWKQPLSVISAINLKLQIKNEMGNIIKNNINHDTKNVEKQLKFMTQTLHDFSDFFKPDKELKEFSPKDAIESILSLFGDEFKNNSININMTVKTDTNDLIIFGYNNEFRQVILNILNNAKDAILQTNTKIREVDVLITSNDDNVFISIQDYAGGIDNSVIDTIFEPYVTTKSPQKGTGIGLYMSKKIIQESMGGKLKVYNQNGGAVFVITLASK